MLSRAPGLLKRLREKPYSINVIAIDQKPTEIPGLESLQGAKFDDGRTFEETRGMAWDTDLLVPEENLLCLDQYQTRESVFVHEVAHGIHFHLEESIVLEIQAALENAKNKKLYPDGSYMMKNEWEYFAVGSAIYFGSTYRWDVVGNIRNRLDLEFEDPRLFKVMKRVYAGAEITPAPGCIF